MARTKYAALPHVGVTDIYPVGVLQSLQIIGRALTVAVCLHGCQFFSRHNRCPACRLPTTPAPTTNGDDR